MFKLATLLVLVASSLLKTALCNPLLPPAAGQAIPLFKRKPHEARADTVVDFPGIRQSVARVEAKYYQGLKNWHANTGARSFIVNPANYTQRNETTRSNFDTSTQTTSSESSSPTQVFNASQIQGPAVQQFRYRPEWLTHGSPHSTMERRRERHKIRQSEALIDERNDQLWAGMISIGSNQQPFLIDFDTGSADLWVPNVSCNSNACNTHRKYNPATSDTSRMEDGKRFRIAYGDGSSSSGPVYDDSVIIAGLQADQQAFSAVDQMSASFQNDVQDGLLGLAFQTISELDSPSYFQTLVNQNRVPQPIFSFRLAKQGSELYLGGTNPSKYTGEIDWHTLLSRSYWIISGFVYVNNKQVQLGRTLNTIIDSGTTVIVVPPNDAKTFWKSVPGSASYSQGSPYYTFPCSTPPSVAFTFSTSKRMWSISAADFNLGRVSAGSSRCVGAIVGQDLGIDAWVLGDTFMKNVYSVFDVGQGRVGFAQTI